MQTIDAKVDTTIQKPASQPVGSFGEGRYSGLMAETYKDSKRIFGLSPEVADKLAHRVGTDFGAAMASVPVEVKRIKSVSKDGKITLAEAAKVKGITITLALTALRTIQFVNEAGNFGLNPFETKWVANNQLVEYFESLK